MSKQKKSKDRIPGWREPLPNIRLKQDPAFGSWGYEIWYVETMLYSGSCSRHGAALSAAKRNREWIMRAMVAGDTRFPKLPEIARKV